MTDRNDIVLAEVAQRLRHGRFTGQIILHVNSGVIRKTETRDFELTEDIVKKSLSASVDNGSGPGVP